MSTELSTAQNCTRSQEPSGFARLRACRPALPAAAGKAGPVAVGMRPSQVRGLVPCAADVPTPLSLNLSLPPSLPPCGLAERRHSHTGKNERQYPRFQKTVKRGAYPQHHDFNAPWKNIQLIVFFCISDIMFEDNFLEAGPNKIKNNMTPRTISADSVHGTTSTRFGKQHSNAKQRVFAGPTESRQSLVSICAGPCFLHP